MYGLCSKLVCLFAQASASVQGSVFVQAKDTSLLQNLSISRKLQIHNVL